MLLCNEIQDFSKRKIIFLNYDTVALAKRYSNIFLILWLKPILLCVILPSDPVYCTINIRCDNDEYILLITINYLWLEMY